MKTIVIEVEIEGAGDGPGALSLVNAVLDLGVLQEAIEIQPGPAEAVFVMSCVCWEKEAP